MNKITEVKKLETGVYLINDCIKISNIGITENGEFYSDIEFNEYLVTEEQAEQLVKKFVSKALMNDID